MVSPLIVLIALVIKLTSRGPILFHQPRGGRNARPFTMLKFRSMQIGAESEQSTLAAQNEISGPVFKLRDDLRVPSLGRFLRRHSLDELPQLWNVLRGEMSLIGHPASPGRRGCRHGRQLRPPTSQRQTRHDRTLANKRAQRSR
ncbi:MAG: sugar transferase [Candidatus Synoicihabitans palmerolidicus]|nr:sugar transferase [Candidatus Synoicihabitans palmerolidicus]